MQFIAKDVDIRVDDSVMRLYVAAPREAGKYRLEGRDYLFKDGDVALFKFNT